MSVYTFFSKRRVVALYMLPTEDVLIKVDAILLLQVTNREAALLSNVCVWRWDFFFHKICSFVLQAEVNFFSFFANKVDTLNQISSKKSFICQVHVYTSNFARHVNLIIFHHFQSKSSKSTFFGACCNVWSRKATGTVDQVLKSLDFLLFESKALGTVKFHITI